MNNTPSQETTYDFSKFTNEDRKMYKDVLLSYPYNPDLAEFFYEQKRYEERLRNERRRHVSRYSSDAYISGLIDYETPEEIFLRNETYEELMEAVKTLPEIEQRRFLSHYIDQKSYKAIADEEGVHWCTVRNSVLNAKERIVNYLQQYE